MKELEKKDEGCREARKKRIQKYEEAEINNGKRGEQTVGYVTKIKMQVSQTGIATMLNVKSDN